MNKNDLKKFTSSVFYLKRIKEGIQEINVNDDSTKTSNRLQFDSDGLVQHEKKFFQGSNNNFEKRIVGLRNTSSTWWERVWSSKNYSTKDKIKAVVI